MSGSSSQSQSQSRSHTQSQSQSHTQSDCNFREQQEPNHQSQQRPLHQQQAPNAKAKRLPATLASTEGRIDVVRRHYVRRGYRVQSGLSFGCHLVLYADDPDRVHSDFCVHVVGPDNRIDWRTMQTLARSMPDLHKTLILANVRPAATPKGVGGDNGDGDGEPEEFEVDELAIATEHAPFRHREARKGVGEQRKGTGGGGEASK